MKEKRYKFDGLNVRWDMTVKEMIEYIQVLQLKRSITHRYLRDHLDKKGNDVLTNTVTYGKGLNELQEIHKKMFPNIRIDW